MREPFVVRAMSFVDNAMYDFDWTIWLAIIADYTIFFHFLD